jgi:hypothetical protein
VTSETLVNFYQTTRRYNPEDSHLRTHRRENLKSFLLLFNRIDTNNARGQGYENPANMAGKYNGLQANVLQEKEFERFVPYAAHSINIAGVN